MNKNPWPGEYHICPVCGATFFVSDSKSWVYKIKIIANCFDNPRYCLVCSWKCLRSYEINGYKFK